MNRTPAIVFTAALEFAIAATTNAAAAEPPSVFEGTLRDKDAIPEISTAELQARAQTILQGLGHAAPVKESVGHFVQQYDYENWSLLHDRTPLRWGALAEGRAGLLFRFQQASEPFQGLAARVNDNTENIGARRLHTVMERLLDELSFSAPELSEKSITIDAPYVERMLADIVKNEDLSRYIL